MDRRAYSRGGAAKGPARARPLRRRAMKPSIYDLTHAFLALAEEQEQLEGSSDEAAVRALWARWEALEGALEHKVDGTLALVKELEARGRARKEEATRLAARARVDEATAKRLKGLVEKALDAAGRTRLETPRFRVSIAEHGGILPLVKEDGAAVDKLPADLVKVVREPDLERIRACLEAGKEVVGYHLGARGHSLRVS